MIKVRPATLADVPAIVAIHRSDIVTWKWWDENGEAHWADYAALTPAQRWANGGPWMDESTFGPHLERWTTHGGWALVAEEDGRVVAEAEVMEGEEPTLGKHLNLSVIYTLRGQAGRGLGSALMAEISRLAAEQHCQSLVVSHADAVDFYAKHGFEPWQTWRRAQMPVAHHNTQYQAEFFADAPYEVVRGWAMPIGRYQSARQEWERMRPGAEPDFAEWRALRLERWHLTVRRQPAYLVLDEAPRAPGVADVHLWLPPGQTLTRQHLTAIQDRAAQSGYRELQWFLPNNALTLLGTTWEHDGYQQAAWWKAW